MAPIGCSCAQAIACYITLTSRPSDHLTATYNRTFVRAYNLAHGAGTVDETVIPPAWNYTYSLKQQVDAKFTTVYASRPAYADWQPDTTLFAFFFGVVDIIMAVRQGLPEHIIHDTFISYRASIDKVRHFTARLSGADAAAAAAAQVAQPPRLSICRTRSHIASSTTSARATSCSSTRRP